MNTFTHKGYGRIYVESDEDARRLDALILELDAFEHGYMPKKLIALFSEYPAVTYLHKFSDMDTDMLTAVAWKRGIKIWCFDSGNTEYPRDATKSDLEPKPRSEASSLPSS